MRRSRSSACSRLRRSRASAALSFGLACLGGVQEVTDRARTGFRDVRELASVALPHFGGDMRIAGDRSDQERVLVLLRHAFYERGEIDVRFVWLGAGLCGDRQQVFVDLEEIGQHTQWAGQSREAGWDRWLQVVQVEFGLCGQ